MWPTTSITKLLKIKLPIIQAPMAGAATPALVAAVSNAGGLGSLAAGYMEVDQLREAIRQVRQLTSHPFNVNLFVPELNQADLTEKQIKKARDAVQSSCAALNLSIELVKPPFAPNFDEQMQVILEENISIFSFTFGIPAEKWLTQLKNQKVFILGTATNLLEAEMLEEKGIDIIIAQGSEAGGHRGTFVGEAEDALFEATSLTTLLGNRIRVPIVTAGGIMDEVGIVTALKLGAQGVQMGTAFLTCPECGIHNSYKNLLMKTSRDQTVLTRAFSGKLARGIKNQFITEMEKHIDTILSYPAQNKLTINMRKEAAKRNLVDYMSMWAGQAAYLSKGLPAAELINKLDSSVKNLLAH